jgi:modulator of FtsH protease
LAYRIGDWESFALAHVGASAALLGLVFVVISINLRDIVGSGPLVHRAGEAVVLLGGVLAVATVVLIPGQRKDLLSAELILLAGGLFAVILFLQRDAVAQAVDPDRPAPPRVSLAIRRVLGLGTAVLIALAGITLAAEAGGGLYWLPAAILAAYAGSLTNAWILIIEILR